MLLSTLGTVEILVQVPQGTNALRLVSRFQGSRPDPAQLGQYRSVHLTIVDPSGTLLFEGPLAPEEAMASAVMLGLLARIAR